MKLLPVLFCVLLICSCSSGKPQYIPPPKPVEPEPVVQPKAVETKPAAEIKETVPVAENSFLDILLKEGIPSENIVPRSKEQVAIYKKTDHFTFYYFKKNQLVANKDYSFAEIDQMKSSNNYPDKALKDLGAIK